MSYSNPVRQATIRSVNGGFTVEMLCEAGPSGRSFVHESSYIAKDWAEVQRQLADKFGWPWMSGEKLEQAKIQSKNDQDFKREFWRGWRLGGYFGAGFLFFATLIWQLSR